MSHLQRVYTDYYYRKENKRLVKHAYMKREEFLKAYPMTPLQEPDGVFPCKHEERGFISKKGKKPNHTHARMKRRNKARIRARKSR